MKKVLLLVVSIILFGCSEEAPSAPTTPAKEYPISHKSNAVDLAIKINQIRRLNGLEEFLYLDNAIYRIGDENTSFNDQTSYEVDDFYYIGESYELQRNDTTEEFISRLRVYMENTENIVDTLIAYNPYITTNNYDYYENVTIAINIVERENKWSKYNEYGNLEWRYGKYQIDYYLYFKYLKKSN